LFSIYDFLFSILPKAIEDFVPKAPELACTEQRRSVEGGGGNLFLKFFASQ
jgi:hypothetical protein